MKKAYILFVFTGFLAICSCSSKSANSNAVMTQETESQVATSVTQVIMQRRSIRKYQPQTIETEKIKQIANCGIWAPNGQGRESWQVRIVSNAQLLEKINQRYQKPFAYGAPCVAFIAYDPLYDLSQVDCGLLGGNMILTAQSLGIGSCCLGGIVRFLNQPENTDLVKLLNLPSSHRLLYAIAFGYPDENPKTKERHTDRVKFIE